MGIMCFGGNKVGKKRRRKKKHHKGRRREEEDYPVDYREEERGYRDSYMDENEATQSFGVESFVEPKPDDNVIMPNDVLNTASKRPNKADSITYSEAPGGQPPSVCKKPESDCAEKRSEECCEEPEKKCDPQPEKKCTPPPERDMYSQEYERRVSKVRTADRYRPQPMDMPRNVVPQKITILVHQNGKSEPISVATNTTDTVFELRFRIFEATRILPSNQILMFEGRDLPLEKQLGECGVGDRSILQLTDHGEAITEYIIEITDAMNVRKLKSDLRKLDQELKDAKKRSADKLRQNDWEGTDRLVQEAQVLERKKMKRQQELQQIHEKHKLGFRQLHVKIVRLWSEKRKSCAEYARMKRELLAAVQRNEVIRSREIVNDLMVQFIRHDGCERELMLLEAFVPDMVDAGGGAEEREAREDDGIDGPPEEKGAVPPSGYQTQRSRQQYSEQPYPPQRPPQDMRASRSMGPPPMPPPGQRPPPAQQYPPDAGYRQRPSYPQEQQYRQLPPQSQQKWDGPPRPQYVPQYERPPTQPQYVPAGPGDRGAFYF